MHLKMNTNKDTSQKAPTETRSQTSSRSEQKNRDQEFAQAFADGLNRAAVQNSKNRPQK